ncbi:hypothetical protein [Kocuria rosea]|jgi:hypothetical protein|uniref:hypothetical protein n=1 Tax=Kocuria rosea TaxID=1275 RepID=UPI00203B0A03|nr:hypothetical protein [Kocuria rosea]MCM3688255.1 hypothetical protein [Kocuria rosea]HST73215.1 hypothetical protein [Kocuria rosea]
MISSALALPAVRLVLFLVVYAAALLPWHRRLDRADRRAALVIGAVGLGLVLVPSLVQPAAGRPGWSHGLSVTAFALLLGVLAHAWFAHRRADNTNLAGRTLLLLLAMVVTALVGFSLFTAA